MTGTYSGQFVMEVSDALKRLNQSLWHLLCCKGSDFLRFLFPPSGFLGLALVSFRSGVVNPLPRHHSHPAGRHLPGHPAPDGHERLPERAAEHAGEADSFIH